VSQIRSAPEPSGFRTTATLADVEKLGSILGRLAPSGLVVGLIGALGAGKTTFVRSVAQGAGVPDPRIVSSPTFVLIHEYQGRLPIIHFDAYRLRRAEEFLDLGVEEYFASGSLCLVEWADRVGEYLPAERVEVMFDAIGETERLASIFAIGRRWEPLVENWRAAYVTNTKRDSTPRYDI
jgi:tRNA threonylcarbamoyladenosine biosynthesis protein TsaE